MQYLLAQTPQNQQLGITAKMANRHGLIAGATGTGKTVTLRKMAEAFSDDGVPVFLVDVKGDLSGLVQPGAMQGKIAERIETRPRTHCGKRHREGNIRARNAGRRRKKCQQQNGESSKGHST